MTETTGQDIRPDKDNYYRLPYNFSIYIITIKLVIAIRGNKIDALKNMYRANINILKKIEYREYIIRNTIS